ncbi:MAG TPA: NAD(+)/NADH kinase [Sedimentisphaerales bacterium]|nr:NAD(+)/NADH kinase [Sedimentisphaerales bacterium]
MNVRYVITADYEKKTLGKSGKNEPKTNPNEPKFKKAKMNVSTISTKDYENISNCTLAENKPNFNPKQSQSNPICRGVASGETGSNPILVDCWSGFVDNLWVKIENLIVLGDKMAKSGLPKLVVFGDPTKGHVTEIIAEFLDFAKGKAEVIVSCGIEECTADILKEADFAVVFGGDGSITSAARQLSQVNVPVIGVNLGKLGYLAEFNVAELKEFFPSVTSGKARTGKRMMLSCGILGDGQEKFRSAAINDVVITAGPPFKMIELQISVDGQPLAGCISDGLIISTPTGSTAYNLSCGGPILSPKMEAMVITPMCPHSLSFRPIVINADSKVEVFGVRVNEGTTVSMDGQVSCKLSIDDVVRIERHKGDFLVVNNPLRTQWDTLATKLSWAEKPKYKRNGKPTN